MLAKELAKQGKSQRFGKPFEVGTADQLAPRRFKLFLGSSGLPERVRGMITVVFNAPKPSA
jgi:hypothetical protein